MMKAMVLLLLVSLATLAAADTDGCESECRRKYPGEQRQVCNSARGVTYSSRCSAEECAKVSVDCETACPCKRVCEECANEPRDETTVRCASGNIQYDNDCEVRCNNAVVECEGKCPCWGEP